MSTTVYPRETSPPGPLRGLRLPPPASGRFAIAKSSDREGEPEARPMSYGDPVPPL